ncbi:MAG: cation:proton antiporter regulatory subunit [Methermicoccaceae archaeon]
MAEIHETELPGVGKKYTMETKEHSVLVVVIHSTGQRELYLFEKCCEEPSFSVTLTDEEARLLGAVLEGAYYQPLVTENLELVMEGMTISWVKVEEGSALANRTIAELHIRKRTGVSIIAIIKGDEKIPNPSPDTTLMLKDTLMCIGSREQFDAFKKQFGVE